jgi:site-specific DNA-methyltransferase (adenine-specific)
MPTELFLDDCVDRMRQMSDGCIDMILSDIPYGEVSQKSSGLRKLDRGNADRIDFDVTQFAHECVRLASGSIYIFCGIGQISIIDSAFRAVGLTTRLGQWEKANPSPMNGSRLWLSGSEFCVFARKPNATFNRHCEKPLWRFPVGRSKTHPTEKPVALMEYLIRSSSNVGDVIADFTMGSGTAGVACKNTGRRFIGVEKDPCYFDIAKKRISEAGLPE